MDHPLNKVEEVFAAALEIESRSERSAYLDETCGDDFALRERVEALLLAYEQAGSVLTPPRVADSQADTSHDSVSADPETTHDNDKGLQKPPSDSKRPATDSVLMESFGDYELLGEISRGGMGVVYKARQVSLNRLVALKMILTSRLDSESDAQRFQVEAEAAAKLDHPGIVPIHEVGEINGRHYISMGLVDGGSLADRVKEGPLPSRQAAGLVRQIAEAVHFAHTRNIVHRDLKLANILLDSADQPKVTDFGLAKNVEAGSGVTLSGQILGTPSYMPPEQASGKLQAIGPLADVYALGAVLYCLLTGHPPFRGENVLETLRQVQSQEPVSPRQLNSKVDLDLATICLKCLEKDPLRRYGSAAALAEELQRWLQGKPIVARPVGTGERAVKWIKRHPARAGVIATGAFALLTWVGMSIGYVYQQRLQDAYTALENANGKLNSSLKRERGLTEDLQDSLHKTETARTAEATQRKIAEAAQAKAEHLQHVLDQILYFRRVSLALSQWNQNEIVHAKQLLAECPLEHRNWEWHYVHRLCYSSMLPLQGHIGEVRSVCYSPDGKRIASAGGGYDRINGRNVGQIKLWNATTGKCLLTIKKHKGPVKSVCFSPDGQKLASAGMDETIRIWNAKNGKELAVHNELKGNPYHVAFSPDGKYVASKSYIDLVIWDTTTSKVFRKLRAIGMGTFAFSPDSQYIASTSRESTPGVWNLASGKKTLALPRHISDVFSIAYDSTGKRLATGSGDKSVKIWNTTTGKLLLTLRLTGGIRSVAFSRDGTRIAAAGDDKTVNVWDANTGEKLLVHKGHSDWINQLAIHPDGRQIASASKDGTVRVWNTFSNQESLTLSSNKRPVYSASFSPDGKRIASTGNRLERGSRFGEVNVWDANNGRLVMAFRVDKHGVTKVAFSPDGKYIATRGIDQTVGVWDAVTGRQKLLLKSRRAVGCSLAFSPDAKSLASGNADQTIKVWDLTTGKVVLTLRGHTAEILDVAYSPRGKWIASAGYNHPLILWDATTGRQILALKKTPGEFKTVTFSPDGQHIAMAARNIVEIRNAQTGLVVKSLKGHISSVTGIAFSPDGQRIATSSFDKTVRIWDTNTGQETLLLKGHLERLWSVTFSPDGRRLATTSSDGTIRIWDAESGLWDDTK